MKKRSWKTWLKVSWIAFGVLFTIWQWSTFQARGVDARLLAGSPTVSVAQSAEMISFRPDRSNGVTVLFFPGGLVDPEAYVPLGSAIAEAGYPVHVIKMPWRMATKGYNQIKELFDWTDDRQTFVLGGHSQGGKMAAQFAYENPEVLAGLFLLGTSHPRDIDLSAATLPTLKIYGEYDGMASVWEVRQNRDKLPPSARLHQIAGGNHSQFGYMGHLLMDDRASISRAEQHRETVAVLVDFLRGIAETRARYR